MGLRFRKYISIIPGVKVNISKSGFSTTIGPKGASVNVGKRGVFVNAGLPGTGIFMRERISAKNSKDSEAPRDDTWAIESQTDKLNEQREYELKVWLQTPRPMEYPKYNRCPMEVQKPEKHSIKKQCTLYLKVGFVALLLSYFYGSTAMEILSISVSVAAVLCSLICREIKYKTEMSEWQKEYDKWDSEQKNLEEDFVAIIDCGKEEPDEALSIAFNNIEWPYLTYISYEIKNDTVFADIDLPEIEMLPEEIYIVKGRGNSKEIGTKTKAQVKQREEYAQHIHGVGMLVCGTIFSVLQYVNTVVVSGYSQRKSKQSAETHNDYLFSFKASRHDWSTLIDFNLLEVVDPVDELEMFALRRDMTSNFIFKPIEPYSLELIDDLNMDFEMECGFRDIKWGVSSSSLENLSACKSDQENVDIYVMENENLQFGKFELSKIFYVFYIDRFCSVELQSAENNYNGFRKILTEKYGESTSGNTEIEELKWNDMGILLLLSKNDGSCVLNVSSVSELELYDQVDSELEREKKHKSLT